MEQIAGYRIVAPLGGAGDQLGVAPDGRYAVLRTVSDRLAADPGFREHFRRETTAALSVSSPYTADVVAADADAPRPWVAAEYCPGTSLSESVAALGPLGPGELGTLGVVAAEALRRIHGAGLVHHGLKPATVVLTGSGPRITGFGGCGSGGSPGFIAPELLSGEGAPGTAADVFAVGALLAMAATGRNPHGAGGAQQVLYRTRHSGPDLVGVPDAEWAGWLVRCLAKYPADRPTVPELARWCAERAGDEPWWEREPLLSMIRDEETYVAELASGEGESGDGPDDGGWISGAGASTAR
jgi:serine/threonine protein kinase